MSNQFNFKPTLMIIGFFVSKTGRSIVSYFFSKSCKILDSSCLEQFVGILFLTDEKEVFSGVASGDDNDGSASWSSSK